MRKKLTPDEVALFETTQELALKVAAYEKALEQIYELKENASVNIASAVLSADYTHHITNAQREMLMARKAEGRLA